MVKEILYRVINCKIHKKRLETFEKLAEKAGLGKIPKVVCVNGKKYTGAADKFLAVDGWNHNGKYPIFLVYEDGHVGKLTVLQALEV